MNKNIINMYSEDTSITLVKYCNFLKSEFKERGLDFWVPFLVIQSIRLLIADIAVFCFSDYTLHALPALPYAILITVLFYGIEILVCWLISSKIKKHYWMGQLTGRL